MPSGRLNVGPLVRAVYERYPYPETPRGRPSAAWRLPALSWLLSMAWPGASSFAPERILVAGCGTGREAFALARRVPGATIVATDFSPRSIAVARRSQRRLPYARRVRFLTADLADPGLARLTGGEFQFVSCHGVLSYVRHPERVLRNLARSATPDGALYLGVNGSVHHSIRWREALPAFGLDPMEWQEGGASRRVLRVLDAMAERSGGLRLARRSASYLSGDVCGPPFLNLPLREWIGLALGSGWHFRGSASCVYGIRGICDRGLDAAVLPRLRPELQAIEELLIPSAFHSLVFTRQPAPAAPWMDPEALLDWHVVRLPLYRARYGSRRSGGASFASMAMNTIVETSLDAAVTTLLRSHRRASIRVLTSKARGRVDPAALRDTLYMLYLLGIIELLPPRS